MPTRRSKKQRLRRDELVSRIFASFSGRYENYPVDSMYELTVPLGELRAELREQCDVEYNSDSWILTQIRRYEREIGRQLFEKVETGPDSVSLAVYPGLSCFAQKHHMYVNQKVRLANGVVDAISNIGPPVAPERALRLLLGSGSIPLHVAEALLARQDDTDTRYEIYTHNIGVVNTLLSVGDSRFEVHSPGGRADYQTYCYIGGDDRLFTDADLDFVIQSTHYVHDGHVFVNTEEESRRKRSILQRTAGIKLLLLIKDEFLEPPVGTTPFGSLTDYDYIVTIPVRQAAAKSADGYFERHGDIFTPYVVHWGYTIFKVDGPRGRGRPAVRLPNRAPVPATAPASLCRELVPLNR